MNVNTAPMNELVVRKKELVDANNEDVHRQNVLVDRVSVSVVTKNESVDQNNKRVVLMNAKAVPKNDGLVLKKVQAPYQAVLALNLQTKPERENSFWHLFFTQNQISKVAEL